MDRSEEHIGSSTRGLKYATHAAAAAVMYTKRSGNGAAASSYKGNQEHHQEHLSKPKLQLQTVVFKVEVHCEACIRKVKKAIAGIDGVETITVDMKQKKVTVTGRMDQKALLKRVAKTGKQVELVASTATANNVKSNINLTDKAIDAKMMLLNNSNYNNNTSSAFPPSGHGSGEESFIFNDDNVNSCSIM